jgi:phage terminase small subunit
MGKLGLRQWRFVQEYLARANTTEAAVKAGYSPKTARTMGSENLTKPDIREALEKAQAKVQERVEVTAERIVGELLGIARDEEEPAVARVSAYREVNDMLGFHAPPKGRMQEEIGLLVIHDMPPGEVVPGIVEGAAVPALELGANTNGA